ncbi:Dynamin family protein [Moraxella cuniculi DSM 21768]|uniref:Dynamin family protein n=1 Tax=Moraxella cuniculi DSM 21768 TaxID=1122245 RepID=A0A1N7FCH5_9GAMM|nr:dynamin family protein [Moraxella cuniculi]OOS07134.1 hypothetical protein B0189_04100 [Moraxella cuniculi]SIR98039.1 Dynamin family protein [Moraxella cuniculi DSM 21768]
MDTQTHQHRLQTLVTSLTPWQDSLCDEISQLKQLQKAFADKLDRFSQDEQTLNIAIMGQVKAGKSSFLNALLFDGKPILPEAATPKTANLTRIGYADTPTLEVEFFGEKEWQSVVALAKTDGTHSEIKVAKEQLAMVQAAGIDPIAVLQQGSYRKQSDNIDEIMLVLNDYAGNDGKYTALVKMIRLYLPIAELAGYNIIDTPGMNDPVISRTQRTKEEMANSDVVFFLSRASNFLDASDAELLTSQLPEAGVKRLVLVAGQYDSAIDQDGYDRKSLADTEANLTKRIINRAKTDIGRIAEQKHRAGQHTVAELLQAMGEPILSSTYAHGFANWSPDNWGKGMAHAHQSLTELARDEWQYEFSQADWVRISGFEALKNAYEQARQDKIAIIESQKAGLLPEAQQNLSEWLKRLTEQLSTRIATLQNSDITSLNQKQSEYEGKVQSIASKLEAVISATIDQARTQQQEIVQSLKQEMASHSQISTHTGTRIREESYEVSAAKLFKPWTWFKKETRYRTYTQSYEYISASEAVENLTNYAHGCISDLELAFGQLVNERTIKLQLRKALFEVVSSTDGDFDARQFRNLIDQSIDRLNLPSLRLSLGDVGSEISSQFQGEVTSYSEQAALKRQLEQSLTEVYRAVCREFDSATNQVIKQLNHTKGNLANQLTDDITREIEQLKTDLQDKQEVLAGYEKLLRQLQEYQAS